MQLFGSVSSLAILHLLVLDVHLTISLWEDISKYIVAEKNDQMLSVLVASMGAVRKQGKMHIIFPSRILNCISRSVTGRESEL